MSTGNKELEPSTSSQNRMIDRRNDELIARNLRSRNGGKIIGITQQNYKEIVQVKEAEIRNIREQWDFDLRKTSSLEAATCSILGTNDYWEES